MEILDKQLFSLKGGNLFCLLEVRGHRGDRINLRDQGLDSGEVIFYSEAPKNKYNCVNCREEGEIELGGLEAESPRQIYLILGRSEGKNEEGRTNTPERN